MIHAAAAIGDFMLILVTSALWVGAGMAAVAASAFGALGGVFLAARHWWRTH